MVCSDCEFKNIIDEPIAPIVAVLEMKVGPERHANGVHTPV